MTPHLARQEQRGRSCVAAIGVLRSGGLVTSRRSSFDARDSYYHLDLDRCADGLAAAGAALHPALHSIPDPAADAEDQTGYRQFVTTAADIDTRVRHLIPTLGATTKTAADKKEAQR
jgi:hypothetical protein